MAGLALALGLGLSGCTALDSALAEVPFLSFMQKSPAPPPYGMPRNAPPGSIPYQSPAGEVFPGLEPTDQSITAFAAAHRNPIPMTDSAALRAGQALFSRYCYVCHGPLAKGDGPILNNPASKDATQQMGKFPFAPNLTLPVTVARPDGYIFGIITAGRGLMPEYGSKIPAPERWYVVNYLRTLQQAAGAAAAPAAPAGTGSAATPAPAGTPATTTSGAPTGAPSR
ncbi:MAG TPA: cytochrome c [Longimicrobiales bacterium]